MFWDVEPDPPKKPLLCDRDDTPLGRFPGHDDYDLFPKNTLEAILYVIMCGFLLLLALPVAMVWGGVLYGWERIPLFWKEIKRVWQTVGPNRAEARRRRHRNSA